MARNKKIDNHLKRLRAIKAVKGKLIGKQNQEIADEMGVSENTIRRSLTYAERAGVFIELEDELLQKVAPAAVKAVMSACEDGDAAVALEVINGLLLLQKNNQKAQQFIQKTGNNVGGGDLLAYAHKLRLEIEERENTLNGAIVGEVKQLPEGNSGNAPSVEAVVPENKSVSSAADSTSGVEAIKTGEIQSDSESTMARIYAEAIK